MSYIELKPGDKIVIAGPVRLTHRVYRQIAEQFREQLPEHSVVVEIPEEGLSLQVISR